MSAVSLVREIKQSVTIPVMAKARIGHFVEAQVLEALGIDYVDESEVLTPADERNHIDKHAFKVPFVCGCRNLGEALRRINEGAAMMRTKGEAGTGNIVEAVRQLREFFDGARTRFDLALAPVGTDFQREVWGAIAQIPFGETISYADYVRCGGEAGARDAGKLRLEGKEYVVADGDVMHFRFNN
jgi:hypothetical protein